MTSSGFVVPDHWLSLVDDSHPPFRRAPPLLSLPSLDVAAARSPGRDLRIDELDVTDWDSTDATCSTRPRGPRRRLHLWSPRLALA